MSENFHNNKLGVKKRTTELFVRRKANMQTHATLKISSIPPFFKTLVIEHATWEVISYLLQEIIDTWVK